jgi:hypothetical protein
MKNTRYPELQYDKQAEGLWRFYNEGHAVGPQYATEKELLADMANYAIGWGYPNPVHEHNELLTALCRAEHMLSVVIEGNGERILYNPQDGLDYIRKIIKLYENGATNESRLADREAHFHQFMDCNKS